MFILNIQCSEYSRKCIPKLLQFMSQIYLKIKTVVLSLFSKKHWSLQSVLLPVDVKHWDSEIQKHIKDWDRVFIKKWQHFTLCWLCICLVEGMFSIHRFLYSCDNYFRQAHTLFLFCVALMSPKLERPNFKTVSFHWVVFQLQTVVVIKGIPESLFDCPEKLQTKSIKTFEWVVAVKMKRNPVFNVSPQQETNHWLFNSGKKCEILPL